MTLSNGCEIQYIGSDEVDALFLEGEIGEIRKLYTKCKQLALENNVDVTKAMTFKIFNRDRQTLFIRFANGRYIIGRFIRGIC